MKTVVITGADRNLGLELAKEFLRRDWRVFAGRFLMELPFLDQLKEQYPKALSIVPLDVSKEEAVEAAAGLVAKETDHVDMLIHNAADVAAVTDDGKVQAVSVGTATITATSKATPSIKAECQVEVATVEAGLKALVRDENGDTWWSEFNTGALPGYDKKQKADRPYVSAVTGASGRLYATTLEDQTSILYSIDPAAMQSTEIGPVVWNRIPVSVTDLAPIPTISQPETDYLLGIHAGCEGLIINASTGVVKDVIELNDGTGDPAVGIAHMGTIPMLDAPMLLRSIRRIRPLPCPLQLHKAPMASLPCLTTRQCSPINPSLIAARFCTATLQPLER